jgi:hypothetical protein
VAGPFGKRGDVKVDLAIAADAGRAEIDLVFVDSKKPNGSAAGAPCACAF